MSTIASILLVGGVVAQVKKSPKSSEFKTPRITHGHARKICPILKKNKYPYQGIGFKLGDPFAITYKIYPNEHWALVGDIGLSASGLSSQYYRSLFVNYIPDDLEDTQFISYLSHEVSRDWCFQTKFLYQWKIDLIAKGVQMYAGLGWQWEVTDLQYSYAYTEDTQSSSSSKILNFKTSRFTHGAVGTLGFEYSYFNLPISAFLETEIFMDTFHNVGYSSFQGGIGIRYIF